MKHLKPPWPRIKDGDFHRSLDTTGVVELHLSPFRLVLEDNPEYAVEIRLHIQCAVALDLCDQLLRQYIHHRNAHTMQASNM